MAISNGSNGKKDLNFELNLLPVFDILSVCICFLLMTVVWVQVSAMNVSQAVGGQSQADTKNPPSVWMTLNEKNDVEVMFKNTDRPMKGQIIKAQNQQIAWNELTTTVAALKTKAPFEIALVMPAKNSNYADIIKIMDEFKKTGIKDVGLSPL